jgi:hypothetical protein
MPRYSWFTRGLLLAIGVLLLLPRFTGVDSGLAPDAEWNHTTVWSTPIWLRLWLLGVLFPTFVASLFFVRRSREARFAAGGFVLSHLPMATGLFELTVGGVGLVHLICWTPALVLLARRRPTVGLATPFGLWVHAMLVVIAVSLAFDARDAIGFYVL